MTKTESVAYEQIRNWLSAKCGIHYPSHKQQVLRQRLSRVQCAVSQPDLTELARRIVGEQEPDLQRAVMHAASTHHTYFFRETDVLDQFRAVILETLRERAEIRIWSAACSTGDEAYTLAIIIAETLGSDALKRTVILGTDISAPVVARAEQGIYPHRHLAHVPSAILNRYFAPVGSDNYQVNADIRACCTFRQMNLMTTPYPFQKMFQAVFCRNVLYYFDRPDQVATLDAIHAATEPGGWLVTSVTESVRDLSDRWRPVESGISRKGGS